MTDNYEYRFLFFIEKQVYPPNIFTQEMIKTTLLSLQIYVQNYL